MTDLQSGSTDEHASFVCATLALDSAGGDAGSHRGAISPCCEHLSCIPRRLTATLGIRMVRYAADFVSWRQRQGGQSRPEGHRGRLGRNRGLSLPGSRRASSHPGRRFKFSWTHARDEGRPRGKKSERGGFSVYPAPHPPVTPLPAFGQHFCPF